MLQKARPQRRLAALFACCKEGESQVAKVNPGVFFNQVKNETAKVVWPTRKETITTGIMVVIMTTILGIFFFGVDSAFSAIVKALLGLLS
jgi:preprotein translocase subunit SecE